MVQMKDVLGLQSAV